MEETPILTLSAFDAWVLIVSAILATACAGLRWKLRLSHVSGQWLNDLLSCGSTIMLMSIGLASILSAIDIMPVQAKRMMIDEMRANGLILAAAFLYSGGVIASSLWGSLKPAA